MRSALRFSIRLALSLAVIVAVSPSRVFAGGPLEVCKPGVPFRWANGGLNIPWNPDQGKLGPLTNAQASSFVALAFSRWEAIPSASATHLQGAPLPVDVNVTNFFPYLFPSAPDGQSAIVFDEDGAIFDLLFGPGSGVLGFAGPEWLSDATCTITEGVSFLNGPAFTNAQVALDIMVHEFGHYQNLAHSIVNGQIVLGDNSGPTPNNTFPLASLVNRIETMYPFYFGPAAGFSTPDRDDIAMFSTLYPEPTFATTTGTITGRILASNGRTPKTGFNVIARNVANPYGDAVSAISSDFTRDYAPNKPLVGVYTLRGLTPGAQYVVYVDQILDGGFSTPPGLLPGPEEFYNGASEDNDNVADNPAQFTAIPVAAGGTVDGVDIIFNSFRPGEPLPLTDDGAFELALPFKFRMCGTTYEEIVVNANGTLSFGEANPDFTESIREFLTGPPQIAGAWDDLNPRAGGSVFFSESHDAFTVTFNGVPERTGALTGVGSNTFEITLKRLFNRIEVRYGGLTMLDGLAGVTCGGAVTSGFETPIDLSTRKIVNLFFQPAAFEQFTAPTPTSPGSPNDLANLTLLYTPTTDYFDVWEPNNLLVLARKVSLPFDSIPVMRFTEIDNPEDVDYFRFDAKAGQVIVAETLSGQLDTVLGLFDRATGKLLAADDDSGAGSLSRLVFTIPADGEYAIAVSTFPDVEFDGGGSGTGRYVLDIHVQAPVPTTSVSSGTGGGLLVAALQNVRRGGPSLALTASPIDRRDRGLSIRSWRTLVGETPAWLRR